MPPGSGDYNRKRDKARAKSSAMSLAGREIGAIPAVADSERRAAGMRKLKTFCERYFPKKFYLRWSQDQLRVVEKMELILRKGGQMALAMPRGSGKSTICEVGAIWGALKGLHKYLVIIAATKPLAAERFDNIKTELATNELLAADFPEIIYPIQCIGNEPRRCAGQLHHGKHTYIGWGDDEITLPTIPGSKASGAVIAASSLLGSMRGRNRTAAGGESSRPSFAMVDDPQTDESAFSQLQCEKRKKILQGAIMNMGPTNKPISICMPCTIIAEGDLADEFTNRTERPHWQGERTRALISFPTNTKLWQKYEEVYLAGLENEDGGEAGNQFYLQHREKLDKGAEVAWPDKFDEGEISAIQHLMNKRLLIGEDSFQAEYQNQPITDHDSEEVLQAEQVTARYNDRPRGKVPADATMVTAFIDVHDRLLYYVVMAWREDFTGAVIDYGTYPEQPRRYFSMRNATRTLRRVHSGIGIEGAIQVGLATLLEEKILSVWKQPHGGGLQPDRVLIDAGYKPNIVNEVCRRSGGIAIPSIGRGITARQRPMSQYERRPGERHGHNWYFPNVSRTREIRHVIYDTNYWKDYLQKRFIQPATDPGSITLFGNKRVNHQMIADHLTESETWKEIAGSGRIVREYKNRPSKPDNHLFDCLVGATVAANMAGIRIASEQNQRQRHRKKLSEIQAEKMKARARNTAI